MHILFVTTYYEPDSGAAAVRLTRLAKLLSARGHQVTVLTTMPHYPQGRIADACRGRFSTVEDRDGVRVVQVWLYATPSKRIARRLVSQVSFMLTAAVRGLTLPRPDVIFVEAQPIFTGFAAAWLSWLKRTPYVANVSDFWPEHLLSVGKLSATHPVYRALKWSIDRMYQGAARLVALHKPLADSVNARTGQPNKLTTIYNGTDLQHFRPDVDGTALRERFNLGGQTVVSFVGTFATAYDFEAMLTVAAHFQQRDDLRFVLFGSGTQDDLVRERLAVGDLPHVVWTGWLDQMDVPAAWAVSDITFWMLHDAPLFHGTIPAKLYELAATGTPVVAANAGEGARLITDMNAGIVVPPGDVDGVIAGITVLLDDCARRARHGAAARAYAEAHFDPETIADAYEAVLDDARSARLQPAQPSEKPHPTESDK